MSTFNAGTVHASLTLDKADFIRELRSAQQQVRAFAQETHKVSIGIDNKQVTGGITHVRNQLKELTARKHNVNIGIDSTRIKASVNEVKAAMAALDKHVEVKLTLNAVQFRTELAAVRAELALLDAKTIEVDVKMNVDKRGLAGLDLSDLGRQLSGLQQHSASASAGVSGLSNVMAKLGALIAIAIPLLLLFSTVIAGLPALLMTLAAPIAAIALGMDGIKAAFQPLMPAIDAMKASLSALFQTGLQPLVQALQGFMPVLQSGLMSVAQGLIAMLGPLTQFIKSTEFLGTMKQIFLDIGLFFTSMGPAVATFAQALLKLTTLGTGALPILGAAITDMANKFQVFVDSIQEESLNAAMEGLAKLLGGLMDLFLSIMKAGLEFTAVMGGPLATILKTIGTALELIMPAVSALVVALTPLLDLLAKVFVGALQVLMPLITTIANLLGSILAPIISALSTLLTPLIGFFQQLANMVGTFLTQAVAMLMPLLEAVLGLFKTLFAAIQPLLPILLQLIQTGFNALISIIGVLIPPITQLINSLGPLLTPILEAVAGVLKQVIAAVSPLVPIIVNLATQLINMLVPIMIKLFEAIAPIIPQILSLVGTLVSALVPVILELFTALSPIIPILVNLAATIISQLLPVILSLLPPIIQLAQELFPVLADIISAVLVPAINILVPIIDAIAKVITQFVLPAVVSFVNYIKGELVVAIEKTKQDFEALKAAWERVKQGFIDAGNAIKEVWNQFMAGINQLKADFDAICNAIKAAWTAVGNELKRSYDEIIQPMVDSFKRGWEEAKVFCERMWNDIKAAWEILSRELKRGYDEIIQPMIDAFKAAWEVVQRFLTDEWNKLKQIWRELCDELRRAYEEVIVPMWNALKAAWTVVQQFLTDEWNKLKQIWRDLGTELKRAYDEIIKPMWDALQAAWRVLQQFLTDEWNKLKQIWRDLGTELKRTYDEVIAPMWEAFKTAFEGVKNFFETTTNKIGEIWNSIKGKLAEPINFFINTVWNKGVVPAWNKVAEFLPGLEKAPELTPVSFHDGGIHGGKENHRAQISRGGSSQVRIWGEPETHGEAYIPLASTKRQRSTKVLGQVARNFGYQLVRQGAQSYADSGVWRGLKEVVEKNVPGARMSSGYRPGSSAGNGPDHHSTGNAADFGGPLGQINSWIAQNYGANSLELIYTPGVNIKNGKPITYSAGVQAGHYDHVHWAMANTPGEATGAATGGGFGGTMRAIVLAAFDAIVNPLMDQMKEKFKPPPAWHGAAYGVADKIRNGIRDWIGTKGDAVAGPGGGGSGGAGVEQWRGTVQEALRILGQPESYTDLSLRRMNQESGGNPRAINLTDSNARKGTPSKGLMQVIDPTFAAVAEPPHNVDIWDPLSNILAGMRWSIRRYGSIPAGFNRAGGYRFGGMLGPGQLAFNETSKPEAILNPEQTKLFLDVANGTWIEDFRKAYMESRDDVGFAVQLAHAKVEDSLGKLVEILAANSGSSSDQTSPTNVTINSSDSGWQKVADDMVFALRHNDRVARRM